MRTDALAHGIRRIRQVWGDHTVDFIPQWVSVWQWLWVSDIQTSTGDNAVLKRFSKSVGINQRAAANVDHNGMLWHLFQSIRIDHVVSFRSEWCQHHEVVRSWPNPINLVEGEYFIGAVDRLSRTVYRNNLRAKALQHRNQLLANSTSTDNCHGLVFKKEGRIRFGLITYRPGLSQCHALV